MKLSLLFALLALVAAPFAAQAGSSSSDLSKLSTMKKPGEWQVTVTRTMSVPGTKMSIPPKTITKKECVTQKDLDKLSNFTPTNVNDMKCNMTKKDLSGNTFNFAMTCTGKQGSMNINGTTVFDSKEASHSHIDMAGKMQSMPMNVSIETISKRLGECAASSDSSAGK